MLATRSVHEVDGEHSPIKRSEVAPSLLPWLSGDAPFNSTEYRYTRGGCTSSGMLLFGTYLHCDTNMGHERAKQGLSLLASGISSRFQIPAGSQRRSFCSGSFYLANYPLSPFFPPCVGAL